MNMSPLAVFALQSFIATLVYGCLGVWFLWPWLKRQPEAVAMPVALVPFALRFVGAANVVPGVVGPGYPMDAAYLVLVGDCACALLALAAMGAYRFGSRRGRALAALTLAESVGYGLYYLATVEVPTIVVNLHAHWYVGAMVVPLLTLNNVLVAALLWHTRKR
jgi:hypothetical protein